MSEFFSQANMPLMVSLAGVAAVIASKSMTGKLQLVCAAAGVLGVSAGVLGMAFSVQG